MKFTKEQIKQLLKENMGNPDSALLTAIGTLTQKIENLDVSIDYLAGAVTGQSPAELGYAQDALGRFGRVVRPKSYRGSNKHPLNDPTRMNEIVDAIVQELGTPVGQVYAPGEFRKQNDEIRHDIEEILGPYIEHMLKKQDAPVIADVIEDAVRDLLMHRLPLREEEKYKKSFYKSKEERAEYLIDKGVPEDQAYGVADKQMAKAGKKKKK